MKSIHHISVLLLALLCINATYAMESDNTVEQKEKLIKVHLKDGIVFSAKSDVIEKLKVVCPGLGTSQENKEQQPVYFRPSELQFELPSSPVPPSYSYASSYSPEYYPSVPPPPYSTVAYSSSPVPPPYPSEQHSVNPSEASGELHLPDVSGGLMKILYDNADTLYAFHKKVIHSDGDEETTEGSVKIKIRDGEEVNTRQLLRLIFGYDEHREPFFNMKENIPLS